MAREFSTVTVTTEIRQPRRESAVGVVGVFAESSSTVLPVAHAVKRTCRVGRAGKNDLVLDDSSVSREHALLDRAPRGVRVTDLGSHNGTFINGTRVTDAATLAPIGSTIRWGTTLFVVVDDASEHVWTEESIRGPLVGGARVARARERITQVAKQPLPVLLLGETGTGKELAARAIHDASGREGDWVTVNCGALPASLVESELFGHASAAFTGSERARDGLFRAAHRGTLLLDEIGELPIEAQSKLLRVLDAGEVRSVGSDVEDRVEVRIVAATHRGLEAMVDAGEFRADLLHRLSGWVIELPALRDRPEDVPLLCAHFLADQPIGFEVDAMDALVVHDWPGNARELRNTVVSARRSASASSATRVEKEHLPALPRRATVALEASPDDRLRVKLETALAVHRGNISRVARALDMPRPTLYDALKRCNLDPDDFRR